MADGTGDVVTAYSLTDLIFGVVSCSLEIEAPEAERGRELGYTGRVIEGCASTGACDSDDWAACFCFVQSCAIAEMLVEAGWTGPDDWEEIKRVRHGFGEYVGLHDENSGCDGGCRFVFARREKPE